MLRSREKQNGGCQNKRDENDQGCTRKSRRVMEKTRRREEQEDVKKRAIRMFKRMSGNEKEDGKSRRC